MTTGDSGTYKAPHTCEKCGSPDVYIKALIMANGNIMVKSVCGSCGESRALAKAENLRRRTSTPLNKWREKVLTRDGNRCQICGSEDYVQAHHIIPVRNSQEYKFDVNNGIALCKGCHRLVHIHEYRKV